MVNLSVSTNNINLTNITYFEQVQPGTGASCYDAELLQGVCDAFVGGALGITIVGLLVTGWNLWRAIKRTRHLEDEILDRFSEIRYEVASVWVFLMMLVYLTQVT